MRRATQASTQTARDEETGETGESGDSERRLRYELIRQRLRQAIVEQRVAPGLVLLEGPVAKVFGTSRIPVRKAFELLHAEGLLSTFDGRGYLVARPGQAVQPLRLTLDAQALGLEAGQATIHIPSESERIHDELEQSISIAMIFGRFQIDESAAMDHFNVNRVALREVLSRLVDRGLVEKSTYAAWRVAALTARAVNQDFELLALLAPAALRESGPRLDRDMLASLRHGLQGATAPGVPDTQEPLRLEQRLEQRVEQHLHGDFLARHPNDKLVGMLQQCQMPWLIHSTFCRMFPQSPNPPLTENCRQIVDALWEGEYERAAQALQDYLAQARKRAQLQLKVLAVLPETQLPAYLVRQT
ncbi:GntR family transcriptional regulator [Delftia sp. GW456-R20]|uniref:GntR family transcriptional regulator n=1 Tax=Delftia sp. GW456-R20 TaxID=1827145 RepID=UPI0007AEE1AE|nr:GntR family transcriptional regulator [Delftia sp. GW456-R20]KZK28919.1 GntR family transcriptional regulator [Delftia sp. GW456-R20]